MIKAFAYQYVKLELGYSEVLTHLRVAGQACRVRVLPNGVQLLEEDGRELSFPVTHTEGGIDYQGLPDLADHHGCDGVGVNFDSTWFCYTHEIHGAPEE